MIAAFDLATRIGWARGAGDCLPLVGSHALSAAAGQIGAFLSEFELWLAGRLTDWEPSLVIFESPAPSSFNSIASTRKTQGLAGVLEMVCYRRNIEVREAAPATLKKALAGHGRAKKPAMVAAARAYGLPINFHDEADAFAAWLCAVRKRRPDVAARWDPINFTERAA